MKEKRNKPKEGKRGRPAGSLGRFALTYILLMGAFFVIIGFKPIQDLIDLNGLYTKGVVFLTVSVLKMANIPCTHQDSVINLPSIALDVKFGCNGLEAVMIYSVAVIAFPATIKKKIIGILAGFIILQVLNIFRIAGLAYSGIYFRGLFEYIHIYVAQGMMIAISLGIFFIYLSYANRQKTA